MKTKKCRVCGQKKSHELFYKEHRSKDGLQSQCKDCKRIIDRESRKNTNYYNNYQKSPEYVFSQLKYQAKKRNINFEIDELYYHEHLAHESCFYCGDKNTKHWIDRYNNDHSIGYTKENSVACCEMCNKMKHSISPDAFLAHCNRIVMHNI